MSTRAEVLDEERKKAEVSLEGLKSKLKNLEEVQSVECLISPKNFPTRQMNKQIHKLGNIIIISFDICKCYFIVKL